MDKPKRKGRVVLIIIIILVVLAAAGLTAFFLLREDNSLPPKGEAAIPYIHEGEVLAMSVAPTPAGGTEEGWREYFQAALAFAGENDINTLIFEAKQGLAVYWRDSIFPPAPEVAEQDGFVDRLDPLAILLEEAKDTGIQVWVSADIYSAAGYSSAMKGKAAEQAKGLDGAAYFPVDDPDYRQQLANSLGYLPHKYGVAGLILNGLEENAANPSSQQPTWAEEFTKTVDAIHTIWKDSVYPTNLGLAFDGDAGYLLGPEQTTEMVAAGKVQYLLPRHTTGEKLWERIALWDIDGAKVVQNAAGEDAGLVLFTAATGTSFAGALLGDYPEVNVDALREAEAALQAEEEAPKGFEIPQTLVVNYPAEGARITTEGLFIMGTSDPSLPLLMNGEAVERYTDNGTFGVAVTVAEGANAFTFTQGETSATLNVTRPTPSGGGSSGGETPWDSTREAQPGEAVQVTSLIATAMTDPHDDSAINETLHRGATFVVQETVQTRRYNADLGKTTNTWAYRMPSGDYVLARNCTFVESGTAAFTGLEAQTDEGGEWLNFTGSGTPAAYMAYDDETGALKLTLYDTGFELAEGFSSRFVSAASVNPLENGVELVLQTNGIWGYSLEYNEGQTRLFLKQPPVRSSDAMQPLAGVRVMLDPGHGGDDIGAPGLMNTEGYYEKDVNFRLAQAIAYRLRQLGAEVLMTREDDTFISLEDRLEAQTIYKPDFFISVHHNSAELDRDRNDAKGTQVYYYHPYSIPGSKQLGQALIDAVSPATGRTTSDAMWSYFYVTRTTVCPSVLFEYGFMINPEDFSLVTSVDGIYAEAYATAEAILKLVPEAAA